MDDSLCVVMLVLSSFWLLTPVYADSPFNDPSFLTFRAFELNGRHIMRGLLWKQQYVNLKRGTA
jgi:hypothetical protein